jgi:hypothetical protein
MNDNSNLNNLYDDRYLKKINMFVGEVDEEENDMYFDDEKLKKYSKKSKCYIAFDDGIFNLTQIKNDLNNIFQRYFENNLIKLINTDKNDNIDIFFNFLKKSDDIKRKFYDIGFNLDCGIYYANKKIKQNIRFCINNKIKYLSNILRNINDKIKDDYNVDSNYQHIKTFIDDLKVFVKNNENINIITITDNNYIGIYFSIYNTVVYFLFLIFIFIIFLIIFLKNKNKKMLYALVLISLVIIYFYYKRVYKFKKLDYKYRLESIYNRRKPDYLNNLN